MHCKKLLSAAIACVLFMLSGCDRTTESSNYRLNISPSLGFIKNATVRIYAADGRTIAGKSTTGITGKVSMFPSVGKGPLVISVQGDGDATYFDEYLQTTVSLPAGYNMRALVPDPHGDYGVSPLTEMAYRIAVAQSLFPLTAEEVNILNERVRAAMAPELNSIIQPMTILNEEKMLELSLNGMTDTQANRYALRLATLAYLGAGQSRPAWSVMDLLANDILDGVIDTHGVYDPDTIADDSTVIINNLASMYAGTDLLNAVGGYAPINLTIDITNIDDGSNFSGCKLTDTPEMPPALANLSRNMIFQLTEASSPFIHNEVVLFTFCATGQLRITHDYKVVDNSVTKEIDELDPTPVVYSWRQAGNNMLYELIALDDAIYELNIYGENGAIYYGRFVPY